LKLITQQ